MKPQNEYTGTNFEIFQTQIVLKKCRPHKCRNHVLLGPLIAVIDLVKRGDYFNHPLSRVRFLKNNIVVYIDSVLYKISYQQINLSFRHEKPKLTFTFVTHN